MIVYNLKLNNPLQNQTTFKDFLTKTKKLHVFLLKLAMKYPTSPTDARSPKFQKHNGLYPPHILRGRITRNAKGARALIEAGFEYVYTAPDGLMLFEKPK